MLFLPLFIWIAFQLLFNRPSQPKPQLRILLNILNMATAQQYAPQPTAPLIPPPPPEQGQAHAVPDATVINMTKSDDEADIDITCPAIAGFAVGYFTWLLGLFLCCFGGDGRRTTSMRKGLALGMIASTIPIIILVVFIVLSTRNYYYYYHSITNTA